HPGAPGWSPDGRFVFFAAGIGGSDHLFRVASASASRVEQITTGERHLDGFSPSGDVTSMAYVGQDSAHPDELFVASIAGTSEKRVTSFNDAFVKDVEPRAAERIAYRSKDGAEIEGRSEERREGDARGAKET